MSKDKKGIVLTPLDDIFGTNRPVDKAETVLQIPLGSLHSFKNHPCHVRDDDSMRELTESIRQNGVLCPAIVRSCSEGGYEMIAGHRRKRACELAGLETMPVDIRDVDDDTATLMMVNTNCQREKVLPSEKAFAYKMMMSAIKRQGKRVDLTSCQVDTKSPGQRSDEIVAQHNGTSAKQIQRYIRLTNLIPRFLEQTDSGSLPINIAETISFLKDDEQKLLYSLIQEGLPSPSLSQALSLKRSSQTKQLNEQTIRDTLHTIKKSVTISVPFKRIEAYLPPSVSEEEALELIISLLKERWTNSMQKSQAD